MTMGEPLISVVVPTYERPVQLAACLRALADLRYPRHRFEVIVVDDGGRVALEPVVAPFRHLLDLTLLRKPNAGPAAARNAGVARARGDLLAFTDDDCAPASDWLGALATRYLEGSDRAITGRTVNALPANTCATASQDLIGHLYRYYNATPHQARFVTSNNLAFPAARFREIGGFDEVHTRTVSEDRELCDRWLHRGHEMTYAPEAVVYHSHELSLQGFWRQHFAYGRGAERFRRARASRGGTPIRIEPISFYVDLLRYPFARAPRARASVVAALLVLSQMANAAGFLWEKARPVHGGGG